MNVLILTRSGDGAVRDAAEAIRARGATPWVCATDRMPLGGGVQWSGPGEGWIDVPGQGRLGLSDIHSVWARRLAFGAAVPADWPADMAHAVRGETRHVVLASLADSPAFWVDPPAVYARARHKALQLGLAAEVGLRVPRTLETNDPDDARAFVASLDGPVVAKMFTDVRTGGGTVYTNVLAPDDLQALDALQGCPMILQEAVPKAGELRVVVVGEQVFAVRLPTAELKGAQGDWRRVGERTLDAWRPFRLDRATRRRILALHDRLHTHYGSADLIETPSGELVFLENNAVGESFWLQRHHPLARAWADLLTADGPLRHVPSHLR